MPGRVASVARAGNQAVVPSNTGWPILQPRPIYVNFDDDQSKVRCWLEDPTDGCMTGSRRERSAQLRICILPVGLPCTRLVSSGKPSETIWMW